MDDSRKILRLDQERCTKLAAWVRMAATQLETTSRTLTAWGYSPVFDEISKKSSAEAEQARGLAAWLEDWPRKRAGGKGSHLPDPEKPD